MAVKSRWAKLFLYFLSVAKMVFGVVTVFIIAIDLMSWWPGRNLLFPFNSSYLTMNRSTSREPRVTVRVPANVV